MGLEVACLKGELLHSLAHSGHGVDKGAEQEEGRAFGKSEVTNPIQGRKRQLFWEKACESIGVEEEVSEVTVFFVKGCNRGG